MENRRVFMVSATLRPKQDALCVCTWTLKDSSRFQRLDEDDSLWAGWKQLRLSDVIEEVKDHFPQGGNIQHTPTLTLIVSQYQSHLFIGAVRRDGEREREVQREQGKWFN